MAPSPRPEPRLNSVSDGGPVMKIKGNSLLILYSLMALAACKQEIVAPEQQITGKFALDDGTGLTDRVIEFNCGILSDWHSALFPLADNQIWDSKQQQLILNSQSKYSIQSGTLISSFLNGQIEREGDILTIGESRFVHLNGFRDEPYSVISPEKTQYEIPLQEEEYSFPVTVENPIPAGELTVSTVDDWIAGLTLKDGIVFYRVSTTKKPRQGRICRCRPPCCLLQRREKPSPRSGSRRSRVFCFCSISFRSPG